MDTTPDSPSPHDPLHLVASFNGYWALIEGQPALELWTLTHPVPFLLVGSTYTRQDIERAQAALRSLTLDVLCARADSAPHSCHGVN